MKEDLEIKEKKWNIFTNKITVVVGIITILTFLGIRGCSPEKSTYELTQNGDDNTVQIGDGNTINKIDPSAFFDVSLSIKELKTNAYACYACRNSMIDSKGNISFLDIPPQFKISMHQGAQVKNIKVFDLNQGENNFISYKDSTQFNSKLGTYSLSDSGLETVLTKTNSFYFKTSEERMDNHISIQECNENTECYISVIQHYYAQGETNKIEYLRMGFNLLRIIDTSDKNYDFIVLHKYTTTFIEDRVNVGDSEEKEQPVIAEYIVFEKDDFNMERLRYFFSRKNKIDNLAKDLCMKIEWKPIYLSNDKETFPLLNQNADLCYFYDFEIYDKGVLGKEGQERNIDYLYGRIKKSIENL